MTDSTNNTNALAATGSFALTNFDSLREMNDEYAGIQLDFNRVKLPSGGSTTFEIPSDTADAPEESKTIEGVILFNHPSYARYADKYTGGNNPPDCASIDGITGVGNPGGDCSKCPYNTFGSSGEGQAKACKNKRTLYLLRAGETLPYVISVPTGSLKSFTNYVKSQLTKGRRLSGIVTSISLKKATNASGIVFPQVVFSFVRLLTAEEVAALADITAMVKNYAKNIDLAGITSGNYDVDPETGEVR